MDKSPVAVLAFMIMSSRFEPSGIKNKIKREDIAAKNKKAKNQQKLQKRLAQSKLEANDPLAKKVSDTRYY
jgi:ribosome production factor 1